MLGQKHLSPGLGKVAHARSCPGRPMPCGSCLVGSQQLAGLGAGGIALP